MSGNEYSETFDELFQNIGFRFFGEERPISAQNGELITIQIYHPTEATISNATAEETTDNATIDESINNQAPAVTIIDGKRVRSLSILVDGRNEYPKSIVLNGTTTYCGRKYRATVVMNGTQHDLDHIILVYHP